MGIINNLLLQFVEESRGPEGREAVLEGAGMPGKTFLSEQLYPEEDWQKLVGATVDYMDVDGETAQKAFARWCLPVLLKKFRPFFKSSRSAQQLMEKVPGIHRDFPSSAAEGFVDKISVVESSDAKLIYDYTSPNGLVVFLGELGTAVAEHYGQEVEVESREMGENHWQVEFKFVR